MALELMRSLPEWLTEKYIADLIRTRKESNIVIKILDVKNASEEGDNYLGAVYRVTMECNSLRKSLIVKVMSSGNKECQFLSSFGVFQRELEIYHKILPKLYTVMEEKLGHTKYFSPYCYPTARTDTIILEDLRPLGYKMANRKEQLDMAHALFALKILAKFHAVSYIMGPESIKYYHDIFYSKEVRHLSEGLLTSIVKCLYRTVSSWEGYEKYASSLWHFSESAVDKFNDAVTTREGSFCVLNHGDCWTTNFLFQYCPQSGKLLDGKLIDYQLARYCSPVLDLIYFFYSSLRLDVWKQQEKLLRHYHNELTGWLSLVGCSAHVYTFQDLQKDMREKLPFAIAVVSTVMACALADPGDGPDLEKLFYEKRDSQTCQYDKAQTAEKFRLNLQEFLPYFVKEGVLV